MPIPTYEEIKVPALQLLADGKTRHVRDAAATLSGHFQLTPAECEELLPSGVQRRWHNRVNWALYELYRAGILRRPKRGHYQVTEIGHKIAAEKPTDLNRDTLETRFPEFARWLSTPASTTEATPDAVHSTAPGPSPVAETANERLDAAFSEMSRALRQDLLDQIRAMDPLKFERLVLDVLVKMGYGGSHAEAARLTQRTGDGGIDGIINEDRLGLDVIYLQAKRWQQTVGRRELQAFVGALAGQRANKGVFITSGEFAQTAHQFVASISHKVVLIDGARLADLMIEHGVGVSPERTYVLKRIDTDYFEET